MTLAGLVGILIGVYVVLWAIGLIIWVGVSEMTTGYGNDRKEGDHRFRWRLRESMESHGIEIEASFPGWKSWQLVIYAFVLVVIPLILAFIFLVLLDQVRLT